MNHPAIKQQSPALQPGSATPWSAQSEYRLRRRITNLWLGMWAFFIAGLGMLVMANFAKSFELGFAGALSIGGGVVQLLALQRRREMLGEEMRRGPRGEFFEGSGMLANKPRNTQRLTTWIQHPANSIAFNCGCGIRHFWAEWDGAMWIPNYDPEQFGEAEYPSTVDPGGGRWVILCPCGMGHFKLKLLIVDRTAKDAQ